MAVDERNIVRGLMEGEEDAYRYVFRTYYGPMCILAESILLDEFLAQAAVSDVISHIYEIRSEIEIHSNLRSYLMMSTRNHCLNLLNSKTVRTVQTFSTLSDNDTTDIFSGVDNVTPQGKLLDSELEGLMHDCIEQLPEPIKSTFIKSRFQDMTYRQIGAEDGVSANTIKVRIQQALKLIERRFSKYLAILTFFMVLI
ncbi:MAG: sigma-70 family RNA polymerase sigma factor [Bacteroidaceae bacterium]|nr:sigma-70 family RNA polymerase sigma factor [Prevotella sp.]MBR1903380.1 sigma-70 family RNA polymerase sigma factor [Bacteroidaceae bacterium]